MLFLLQRLPGADGAVGLQLRAGTKGMSALPAFPVSPQKSWLTHLTRCHIGGNMCAVQQADAPRCMGSTQEKGPRLVRATSPRVGHRKGWT